jgi:hypothetical protein
MYLKNHSNNSGDSKTVLSMDRVCKDRVTKSKSLGSSSKSSFMFFKPTSIFLLLFIDKVSIYALRLVKKGEKISSSKVHPAKPNDFR